MHQTYPEAYFSFIDVTALKDSRAASSSVKNFVQLERLKDQTEQPLYGTMERNQFVLDGSITVFPETPPENVPFFGEEQSDKNGNYITPPALDISFSTPHTSIGLTVCFSGDIPKRIQITWYTLNGTRLDSAEFCPDKKLYFCRHPVHNYGRIRLEFLTSGFPCRYAKLNYIEYGKQWLLGRNNIKRASIYEELDATSATLSVNTATLEIVDTDNEFVLSKEEGLWRALQREQEIRLTEYIDGRPVNCGTFFLDDWNCQKNVVSFRLTDLIGCMDKTLFYGGRVYLDCPAGEIIDEIMASCGIRKYTVETEVYDMSLNGWLGIQSHRSALQQVVFACQAVADCSRSDTIKIYRPDRYVSSTIGTGRKFQGTKVAIEDYISAVSVSYVRYSPSNTVREVVKTELPAGKSRVEFSEPYQPGSLAVSGGELLEAGTNYAVVRMNEAGECAVSGKGYEAVQNACTASVPLLEAGETEKTKSFSGCTMLGDMTQAKEIAEKLLNFYQLRQTVELRYLNAGEGVGNWCDITQPGGWNATTGICSQTLDLAGGNIATAKCRGYRRTVTDIYFTGAEIFAGEEGII